MPGLAITAEQRHADEEDGDLVTTPANLGPEVTREERRQLLLRAVELNPAHPQRAEFARLGNR
jgi:hypothetical protein